MCTFCAALALLGGWAVAEAPCRSKARGQFMAHILAMALEYGYMLRASSNVQLQSKHVTFVYMLADFPNPADDLEPEHNSFSDSQPTNYEK
jgi:hypothetical protein